MPYNFCLEKDSELAKYVKVEVFKSWRLRRDFFVGKKVKLVGK